MSSHGSGPLHGTGSQRSDEAFPLLVQASNLREDSITGVRSYTALQRLSRHASTACYWHWHEVLLRNAPRQRLAESRRLHCLHPGPAGCPGGFACTAGTRTISASQRFRREFDADLIVPPSLFVLQDSFREALAPWGKVEKKQHGRSRLATVCALLLTLGKCSGRSAKCRLMLSTSLDLLIDAHT